MQEKHGDSWLEAWWWVIHKLAPLGTAAAIGMASLQLMSLALSRTPTAAAPTLFEYLALAAAFASATWSTRMRKRNGAEGSA